MHSLLFEQFYKNLILGKHAFVKSTSVYKRAILTGALSILLIFISLTYLLSDLYMDIYEAAPYYFVMMGFASVAFFLNRSNHYGLAKAILIYSALTMLYLFAGSESLDSGTYLNYFPLILASFALYGYKHKIYAIVFTLIAFFSFISLFFYQIDIIPLKPLSYEQARINLAIHFTISMASTFLIMIFVTRLNFTIENYLKNNEMYLSKILEELEASKQRLELAFKGSNAGLYDWDIKNDLIYHSPMWKNMLGYSDDELDNFKFEDFFKLAHPEDVDRIRQKINDLLSKKSRFVEEVRLRNKDGQYKWFMDSGMALWDDSGDPIRMVGSIIDITEIKEAEERITEQNKMLEKTNAELDQFVYSTSHDLRAPLMSILGLIELAKTSENEEEVKRFLDLMANRVNRLDEFIGEIIDFSRNSRLEVTKETIMLGELVTEIINDLQFMENSEKIAVDISLPKDFELETDKKRVQTILRNLISNAFKYHNFLKRDPYIKISAKDEGHQISIAITDNGDGIKEDKQNKIFDMFYRGSDKSKGSGLGLYIAKEMTEKIGGTITMTSLYGQGSSFTVYLPKNHVPVVNEEN